MHGTLKHKISYYLSYLVYINKKSLKSHKHRIVLVGLKDFLKLIKNTAWYAGLIEHLRKKVGDDLWEGKNLEMGRHGQPQDTIVTLDLIDKRKQ